jgi:hypothetical protein
MTLCFAYWDLMPNLENAKVPQGRVLKDGKASYSRSCSK